MKFHEESARTARFREEFIGVIGHNLRNPVSAILTGAHALLKSDSSAARDAGIVSRIASSTTRVAHMIDDLSDFTRGRLGGGIQIARPGSGIVLRASGDLHGHWDGERLSQVLANLLGNAPEHGEAGGPVRIERAGRDADVTIQVANRGRRIAQRSCATSSSHSAASRGRLPASASASVCTSSNASSRPTAGPSRPSRPMLTAPASSSRCPVRHGGSTGTVDGALGTGRRAARQVIRQLGVR